MVFCLGFFLPSPIGRSGVRPRTNEKRYFRTTEWAKTALTSSGVGKAAMIPMIPLFSLKVYQEALGEVSWKPRGREPSKEQAFWVGLFFWVKCPQMINLLALACLSLRAAAAFLTFWHEIFRALSTAAGPGRCDLRACVMVSCSSLRLAICARKKETSQETLFNPYWQLSSRWR